MQESPKLLPKLTLFSATMIVMGSIIGSGIFKKMAPMSMKLHSGPLILICWLIAGLITLLGALTFAEIAGRMAQTGGVYVYLRKVYGDLTGFIFGWSCFTIIQTASIASIAFVFAEAFLRLMPFSLAGIEVKVVAITAIWLLTAINYMGVLFGAWVINVFTVLKILGIGAIIFLGFAYGSHTPENFTLAYDSATPPLTWNIVPLMFTAMLGAFWAYDGMVNLAYIGGEVKNGAKNIPRSFIIGVLGVIAIYVLVNVSFLYAMPLSDTLAVAEKPGSIFALEMTQMIGGHFWVLFVSVLIAVSTFGATNGSLMASPRIYYAMAQDGLFFRKFSRVHSLYHTPTFALIAQALWASCLIFLGNFDDLTDMLIFASFIFYGLSAVGLLLLRRRRIGAPLFKVPTWVPVFYAIFCALMVAMNVYEYPKQTVVGCLLIGSGLPVYYWLKKTAKQMPGRNRNFVKKPN